MTVENTRASARFDEVGLLVHRDQLDDAYTTLRDLIRVDETWASQASRAPWFGQISDHPGFTALLALEPAALAMRCELTREDQLRRLKRGCQRLSEGVDCMTVSAEWGEVLQLAEACEHLDIQVQAHSLMCGLFLRPESRNTELALAHGRQAVALSASTEVSGEHRADALVQLGHARFEAGDGHGGEQSHAQARSVTG